VRPGATRCDSVRCTRCDWVGQVRLGAAGCGSGARRLGVPSVCVAICMRRSSGKPKSAPAAPSEALGMGVPNAFVTPSSRGGRTFPSAESKGRSKCSARRQSRRRRCGLVRPGATACDRVRSVRIGAAVYEPCAGTCVRPVVTGDEMVELLLGPRALKTEAGLMNCLEPEAWGLKPGAWSLEPGAWSLRPWARGLRPEY
jgi:hypothetical protein